MTGNGSIVTVQVSDDPFSSPDRPWKGAVKIGHGRRYVLPDPITGEERLWTRVSTVAKTLADTYHLDRWNERMITKGLGLRPDLALLAANLDVTDDKDELQGIVTKAKDAAGSAVGANLGTALHGLCERLDGGEDLSKVRVRPGVRGALDLYQETITENGIVIDASMMERVVLNYEYGIVGRIDRLISRPRIWDLPRIGDLKTGSTLDFGGLDIGIQLALYANADYLWDEENGSWHPFPEIDKESATVIHLPAVSALEGKPECNIFKVDVAKAWEYVRLAMTVREARKQGKSLLIPEQLDFRWRDRIMDAKSSAELSAVWKDATLEGEWSKSLEQFGLRRMEEIRANERN